MAENSKIEWTDHTFNPWVGCTKVSPACDHCYAEGWAKRTGQAALWSGERRRTTAANWRKPIKWDSEAAIAGRPAKVFCASLADVFDNQAEPEWRADLWRLIELTPNLTWQLLTKRPQNIAKMLPRNWGEGWPNVWLGTTVENQAEADRRILHLRAVPAKVHFLSMEPLLEAVDIHHHLWPACGWWRGPYRSYREAKEAGAECGMKPQALLSASYAKTLINWVICGGESGPGARAIEQQWAESLRQQCQDSNTPFFMKQMSGVRKPLPPIPPHLLVRQFPTALPRAFTRGENQ